MHVRSPHDGCAGTSERSLATLAEAQSPLGRKIGATAQGSFEENQLGAVIMHNVVAVDRFIADQNDEVGPLHEWDFSGHSPITEGCDQQYDHSGVGSGFKVSPASGDPDGICALRVCLLLGETSEPA